MVKEDIISGLKSKFDILIGVEYMRVDNDTELDEKEKDSRDQILGRMENEVVEKLQIVKKRIQ